MAVVLAGYDARRDDGLAERLSGAHVTQRRRAPVVELLEHADAAAQQQVETVCLLALAEERRAGAELHALGDGRQGRAAAPPTEPRRRAPS